MDDHKPLKQRLNNKGKWHFKKIIGVTQKYYWDLDEVLLGLANKRKLDKYLKNKPKKRRRYLNERST